MSTPNEADRVSALERELGLQRRLAKASIALHSTLDLDELLGLILDTAAGGVQADRGTVFLLSDDRKELWSRVVQGEETLEIRLPVGQGIAGSVAGSGETIRIDDAYADARFDRTWDLKSGYRTRQVLCAPIRNRDGETVGVFQLLNKQSGDFEDEDEHFLDALSVHAALAVENARLHRAALEQERQEREILLAQGVQRGLQPERFDTSCGALAVAGINELCEDASGDYYDLLPGLGEGRLGIVLGDVSGHGLQAALLMAAARAYLRAFTSTITDPTEALTRLNDALVPDMGAGRFMTLFLAMADTETGEVQWCNAGHNPALHYHAADGSIDELGKGGFPAGIIEGASYEPGAPFTLEPRDVLLVYTDGVTESRDPDGELFELERLKQVLTASAGEDPATLLGHVRAAVTKWTQGAPLDDDVTLLAVRRA